MSRAKLCVLTTTPLIVHFFLKPHLAALAERYDVTIACNPDSDRFTPALQLPVREAAVGLARKISPWRDLLAWFELFRLFRRERFDLVVSVAPKAGLLGMWAAAWAGVPRRVHVFQGEVWASKRGLLRLVLKTADRIVARMATHLLAVSPSERRYLEEQGVTEPGRVDVLGCGSICGVDTARFRPDAPTRRAVRGKAGIDDDAIVCLFLGRLTADKGVLDLAAAFARVAAENPDLRLLLVGPDEDDMARKVRAALGRGLAERVVVEGFTPTPERYLAAADFLCLPSHREGFGMVAIEAAAAGIPAIASRIYGVSDAVVDSETGLLVPPADPVSLAAAITRLCRDAALRKRLGDAARLRAQRDFAQGSVVALYVGYFDAMLSA